MRTIRKALLVTTALATLVFGSDIAARSAYCADCSPTGAVQHECQQEQIVDLNNCCQVYGCQSS
jgi:hypothetical protein